MSWRVCTVKAAIVWIVLYRRSRSGLAHPVPVATAFNQAQSLYDKGQYKEGVEVATRAVEAAERDHGPDSLEAATALHGLGLHQVALADLGRAGANLQRSLEVRIAKLGEEHTDVANTVVALGVLA